MFIIEFPTEEINRRVSDHRHRAERIITGVDLAKSDSNSMTITYTTTHNSPAGLQLGDVVFDQYTNELSLYTSDGWRVLG